MTLWRGRIDTPMDESLWRLSESYSFDVALYAYDVVGSIAHVRGLEHAGLVSAEETEALVSALEQVKAEFDANTFAPAATDEDVHTAIERRVIELAGPTGAKLHTGRSRNDQVATTLRLYTRDALADVARGLIALVDALVALGDAHPSASLPGYTHLQRAQPVLLTHHLQAHAFALLRDVDRVGDARDRLNVSPLGAGALAGTSLPLDPAYVASLLGFNTSFANSLDAVGDRDFVAESLFAIALIGVHLSRMGEELVLWTSSEFNFAQLGDAFTTGSSMLPQKKNSDVAELARGKTGRLVGNLASMLVTLKGLPLAYNRDLQEDKEPLFDSVRQVLLVLTALTGAYGSLTWHADTAATAASDEALSAIDLAEAWVSEGVPFREAHARVGALVAKAMNEGHSLGDEVSRDESLVAYQGLFSPGAALLRRTSPGASGPVAAGVQRQRLNDERARLLARFAV